jgi:hypothetical protein
MSIIFSRVILERTVDAFQRSLGVGPEMARTDAGIEHHVTLAAFRKAMAETGGR